MVEELSGVRGYKGAPTQVKRTCNDDRASFVRTKTETSPVFLEAGPVSGFFRSAAWKAAATAQSDLGQGVPRSFWVTGLSPL